MLRSYDKSVGVMTNQRTGRPSVAQNRRVGLGFLKFLQESDRGDVDSKEQMKTAFLKEYKPRLEKGGIGNKHNFIQEFCILAEDKLVSVAPC